MTNSGFELRVLAGLHRGASLPLPLGDFVIGADPDCDVVLLDDGVQSRHARIVCADGAWSDADTGQPLVPERPFAVGAAAVAICEASQAWPAWPAAAAPAASAAAGVPPPAPEAAGGPMSPPKPAPDRRILLAAAAVLVLGLSMTTLALEHPQGTGSTVPGESARTAGGGVAPSVSPAEQASRLLRDQALDDRVSARRVGERLRLAGEIDPPGRVRLDAVVAELRRRYGAQLPIDDEVAQRDLPHPPPVREMVVGTASHVTLADGRTVYEGQTVDGRPLVRVGPDRLAFGKPRRGPGS